MRREDVVGKEFLTAIKVWPDHLCGLRHRMYAQDLTSKRREVDATVRREDAASSNVYSPSSSGPSYLRSAPPGSRTGPGPHVRREVDAAVRRDDTACSELQITRTIEYCPKNICGLCHRVYAHVLTSRMARSRCNRSARGRQQLKLVLATRPIISAVCASRITNRTWPACTARSGCSRSAR
ncbi:hypothetical protein N9L68_04490 [bacterium]|nr:hypothetical protein [bacterium]